MRRSGLPEERALRLALAYLSRRDRTVAELRARLDRAGIDAGEVANVVAELRKLDYLDDARYARLFVQDRRDLDGWGQERIARSLRERGIDDVLITVALTHADDAGGMGGETCELARARELLERRFRDAPEDPRDRERAYGMLIRKGYEPELAVDAIRSWASEGSRARTTDLR